jgi:hypothetical protein
VKKFVALAVARLVTPPFFGFFVVIFLSVALFRGNAAEPTSDQEQEDKKRRNWLRKPKTLSQISSAFLFRTTLILASALMTPHNGF